MVVVVVDGRGDEGYDCVVDDLPGIEGPQHLLHLVDVLLLGFPHLRRGVWVVVGCVYVWGVVWC